MMMSGIIELKNVSFTAQNQNIIRNFSFAFEEGKATALVGPSGCGKSTVLKLSAGLLVPTKGTVKLRGKDIFLMNRQENLAFRREAAVVFQDSALWANQSLYQILELPLRVHFPKMTQAQRESRIHQALGDVGYRKDLSQRPASLSMGEQKLIAFARAVMCKPTLLFLDEWTESVDDSTAHNLISIVQRHRANQNTVIFVSHDFRIVRNLADYVVMVLDGQFSRAFSREEIENDAALAGYVEDRTKNEV